MAATVVLASASTPTLTRRLIQSRLNELPTGRPTGVLVASCNGTVFVAGTEGALVVRDAASALLAEPLVIDGNPRVVVDATWQGVTHVSFG